MASVDVFKGLMITKEYVVKIEATRIVKNAKNGKEAKRLALEDLAEYPLWEEEFTIEEE